MLDFFPNADHAGIYAAQAGGHFEDAGLKVTSASPPTRPRRSSRWPPGAWTWPSPTSPSCCGRATKG